MTNTITRYLNEIGNYPLIDRQKEVDLAKTIEAGTEAENLFKDSFGLEYSQGLTIAELSDEVCFDEENREETLANIIANIAFRSSEVLIDEVNEKVDAKQEAKEVFIKSNLRLVVSIAKRYNKKTGSLDLLDLIQEGNIGLDHAVDKFDYRKGFKFSTYSTWWIQQAITRAIDNRSSTIRIPTERRANLRRSLQKADSDDELTEEDTRLKTLMTTVSLDERDEETDQSLLDTLGDEKSSEAYENVAHRDLVDEFLSQLPNDRTRDIFRLRFGLDGNPEMSPSKIAEIYGVKASRIDQILYRNTTSYRNKPDTGIIDIF